MREHRKSITSKAMNELEEIIAQDREAGETRARTSKYKPSDFADWK